MTSRAPLTRWQRLSTRGDLSNEQYGILAEAMAESMRAEDRRNA
jgi:hypothetical protein